MIPLCMPRSIRHGLLALLAAGALLGGPARADDAELLHDAQVPIGDAAAIELGKAKYGEKCGGFCHGSGGKGARAPCLVCGRFKRGAKDSDLIRNITDGVAGTGMGAFGGMYSPDEIKALVAYLRDEQTKREAAQ